MNLHTYLKTNHLNNRQFAEKIEVTSNAVGNYVSGSRLPRPDIMQRIVSATDGLVTPNDFYRGVGS